ncbi:MAG TPA: hypothetical protein VH372_13220 [Actinospica sp.]|jgi:hypothetical protein|nr:hypothetical protein [Actinospica sp.]
MFSELAQAEIINGAVLAATLHGDVGTRKIGPFRVLRPFLIAGAIIPLFISPLTTHGTGLTLELAGTLAGIVGGLAAMALTKVYRSPETGRPVSKAGWPYALLWILVIGARAFFSYGCFHLFPTQLAHWCQTNQVTGDAITDALILMAVAMVVVRTLGLAVRAGLLRRAETPSAAAVSA